MKAVIQNYYESRVWIVIDLVLYLMGLFTSFLSSLEHLAHVMPILSTAILYLIHIDKVHKGVLKFCKFFRKKKVNKGD